MSDYISSQIEIGMVSQIDGCRFAGCGTKINRQSMVTGELIGDCSIHLAWKTILTLSRRREDLSSLSQCHRVLTIWTLISKNDRIVMFRITLPDTLIENSVQMMFPSIILLQLIDTAIELKTSILYSVGHPTDGTAEKISIVDIL